jgi:DNA-binding XRE family transcriptional regulator
MPETPDSDSDSDYWADAYKRRPTPARKVTPEVYRWRLILGYHVRVHRKAHGLSQEKLAELAGCDRQSINRIENFAHSPSVDRVTRLAMALGVTPESLVREIDLSPAEED